MPDSTHIGNYDRHTGAAGLAPGVSPLVANKDQFTTLLNCITDVPGIVGKRRGIQNLDHTNLYSALSSLDTTFKPVRAWCFDNNIFVYLENTGHGALAAYDMIAQSWQIVYSASTTKLNIDSGVRKIKQKTFDRTSLILTSLGVYRLSALYGSSATSTTKYSNAFRPAGVVRALDPRCKNTISSGATDHGMFDKTGYNWLPPNSAVAYRVCWIYRDENGLLVTGAPSGKIIVTNVDPANPYCVRIKVDIPAGLGGLYVLQVYRTFTVTQDATGTIPDPGDDMFLNGEYQVTSTNLSNGFLLYSDISPDLLMGDDLYTNEAQDGEDQARFQPPLARCLERFGNCAWYGDVTERQRLTMKLLAVDPSGIAQGLRSGDVISAGGISLIATNTAATEDGTSYSFLIDQTTGAGSEVIRAVKTAESYVHQYNRESNLTNGRYAAYNLTSSNDIFGVIGFEEKSVGGTPCFMSINRIEIPTEILPFPAISRYTTTQVMTGSAQLVVDGAGAVATLTPTSMGAISAGDTISISPLGTANAAGTNNNRFAVTHIPSGEYVVTSIAGGGTTCTFSVLGTGAVASSSETIGGAAQVMVYRVVDGPTGTRTNAVSQAPRVKNRVYWSAPGEFECAPIVNFKDIGNSDYGIQSILATTSSLFIMKEDGVWRVTGTDGDWQIEPMDPACRVVAPDSPAVVAGDIYAYTANGIARISESGVTKVSTPIGVLTDSQQRTFASDPLAATFIQGVSHPEDQAYLISFPFSASPTSAVFVYRYHVPSRNWSQHTYSDNSSGTSGVACMAMARATRYDSSAPAQSYMDRLLICNNSVANSIGVERRDGTFMEYCDYDVGYQTISSYDTANNNIILAASPPTRVAVGDVIWARNVVTPNALYRAPITAISTTTLHNDTITIGTGTGITPLSSWPAVGTVQAVFMSQIGSSASYMPTIIAQGFSTSHVSDLYLEFGSSAMFTDVRATITTDMSASGGSVLMPGFAANKWASLQSGAARSASTMKLVSLNVLMPQEAQRAAFVNVSVLHSHAWEPFDLAGTQVSIDGEAKIRRNVLT